MLLKNNSEVCTEVPAKVEITGIPSFQFLRQCLTSRATEYVISYRQVTSLCFDAISQVSQAQL